MRIKRSILKKICSSSRNKPVSDLDPTTNLNLHLNIWAQLKGKIANSFQKRVDSDSIEKITPVSNDSLLGVLLDSRPPVPQSHERRFGQDVRRLVKLVCRAIFNPTNAVVYIPWDVEEYYLEHIKGKKDRNRVKFPSPQFGAFSEPLTVVDSKDRIVLWYLPGLLSGQHQLDVRDATISIGPLLKESAKPETKEKKTPNWRVNEGNFCRQNNQQACEPGAINFSAGWFAQGHNGDPYPLLPSVNIRTRTKKGQSDWLQNSNRFETLLNLTLSLIHPELFKCGLQILQNLRESERTMEIAKKWQSVFTGIAIISNRITPPHRDTKGKPEWFDLLMNYAGSDAKPKLLINDLGLELEYSSGTVVGLCGMILEHEVGSWGNGDRVCYAHFMRESVRKHVNAKDPGWVYQSMYLSESDGKI